MIARGARLQLAEVDNENKRWLGHFTRVVRDSFHLRWNRTIYSDNQQQARFEAIEAAAHDTNLLTDIQALHALTKLVITFPANYEELDAVEQEAFKSIAIHAWRSLKSLAKPSSQSRHLRIKIINRLATYKLWTLNDDSLTRNAQLASSLFYLTGTSLRIYAWVRFVTLFYLKIAHFADYLKTKQDCESQGKRYDYVSAWAEYVCNVCGNWPYVALRDITASQACLDSLMTQTRSPEVIISSFQQLARHADDLETLDLSQQNWLLWPQQSWHQFVLVMQQNSITAFRHLRLSNTIGIEPLQQDMSQRIAILLPYLEQLQLSAFTLDGYLISSSDLTAIINSTAKNGLEQLTLSNLALNDDILQGLSEQITQPTLQVLNLAFNNLSAHGVIDLAIRLNQTAINWLDLSANPLSSVAYEAIGNLTKSHPLQQFDARNMPAESPLPVVFAAMTQVQQVDFSDNRLTDIEMLELLSVLENSTQTVTNQLTLRSNLLTHQSIAAIGNYSRSTLKGLDISDNLVSPQAVSNFLQSSVAGQLQSFNLSGLGLSDHFLTSLASLLQNSSSLRQLDLSNNAFQSMGQSAQWLNQLQALSLAENNFLQLPLANLAEYFSNSRLELLDLSQTNVTQEDIEQASYRIADSHLRILDLSHNELDDKSIIGFAKHLLQDGDQFKHLSHTAISRDERSALYHAKPASALQTLQLDSASIEAPGARAICRVAEIAGITVALSGNNFLPTVVDPNTCRLNQPNANEELLMQSKSIHFQEGTLVSRPQDNLMGMMLVLGFFSLVIAAIRMSRASSRSSLSQFWRTSQQSTEALPSTASAASPSQSPTGGL